MNKKKLAKGKFGKVSQVSKWDVEIDQDTIEQGTKLTRTWYREGEKDEERIPETSNLSSGEYTAEDGRRILVDSDGIVQMIFKSNKKDTMSKKLNFAQSLLAAFKEVLNGEEQEFTEAKLSDGTEIKYDGELAEGVAVMKVTEEGEMALEDGDYTLEDETAFSIAGGLVTSVTPVEAPEENEFNADNFKKEISDLLDEKLNAFKEGLGKEFAKANIEEKFTKLQKDMADLAEATVEAVVELSEVKPSKAPKTEVKEDRPAAARAVKMAQAIKKQKS